MLGSRPLTVNFNWTQLNASQRLLTTYRVLLECSVGAKMSSWSTHGNLHVVYHTLSELRTMTDKLCGRLLIQTAYAQWLRLRLCSDKGHAQNYAHKRQRFSSWFALSVKFSVAIVAGLSDSRQVTYPPAVLTFVRGGGFSIFICPGVVFYCTTCPGVVFYYTTCPGIVFYCTTCPGIVFYCTTCPGVVLYCTTCPGGSVLLHYMSRGSILLYTTCPGVVFYCTTCPGVVFYYTLHVQG